MTEIEQLTDRPRLNTVTRKALAHASELLEKFYALEMEVRQKICEAFGPRDTRAREVLECRILQNPAKNLEVLGAQFGVNKQTIRMQMGTVLSQLDSHLLQREYGSLKGKSDDVASLLIAALGLSLKGARRLRKSGYHTIGDLKPAHASRFLNPRLDSSDLQIFRSTMTELGYMNFPVEDQQLPQQDPYSGTREQVLARDISLFPLAVRVKHMLDRLDCFTIEQFLRIPDAQFSHLRNCGEVTQKGIREFRDRINAIPTDVVIQSIDSAPIEN